jgi:hypothetical protein
MDGPIDTGASVETYTKPINSCVYAASLACRGAIDLLKNATDPNPWCNTAPKPEPEAGALNDEITIEREELQDQHCGERALEHAESHFDLRAPLEGVLVQ